MIAILFGEQERCGFLHLVEMAMRAHHDLRHLDIETKILVYFVESEITTFDETDLKLLIFRQFVIRCNLVDDNVDHFSNRRSLSIQKQGAVEQSTPQFE